MLELLAEKLFLGEETLAHVELEPADEEADEEKDGDRGGDDHPEHKHMFDHGDGLHSSFGRETFGKIINCRLLLFFRPCHIVLFPSFWRETTSQLCNAKKDLTLFKTAHNDILLKNRDFLEIVPFKLWFSDRARRRFYK